VHKALISIYVQDRGASILRESHWRIYTCMQHQIRIKRGKAYNPQYNTYSYIFFLFMLSTFSIIYVQISIQAYLLPAEKALENEFFYPFHSDSMKSTCGNNIAQRTHPCLLMLFLLSSSQQYLYNYCRDEPF